MAVNQTLIQFFEWYVPADGQHWNRFKNSVKHLMEQGITAAWLPPAYKGTRGNLSEGYDVYDIYDLGEFDQKKTVATKYGSKSEYQAAVAAARDAGLKVYIDVVLNHMGGAEELEKIKVRKVDPENRMKFISDPMEIEAYTKFRFEGRNGKHSNFQWDHHCFTGIDHAADIKENAIFSILNEYGDKWEPMVHDEKGNFDYLILNDIETRNPAVREELKRWIKWYYETVPFDGVRLDAVKHMNPEFFIEWIDFLKSSVNKDLFVLGEFWLSDNTPVLLKYLEAIGNRMSLFDAPLHHNFSTASNSGADYDLRKIFDDSLLSHFPDLSVTFVDNHDTQPLQSLEEYTERWFRPLGYALILLREAGYPCVFYPDLYSTTYSGTDNTGAEREVNLPAMEILPQLLQLRRDRAYGKQIDYFDDANCVGWVREGVDENSGLAVLISNADKRFEKKMSVGVRFAGKVMKDVISGREVVVDEHGAGDFIIEGVGIAVWI
ncbi:MAG: alpha-amylase [Flavitalea sp.]